MVCGNAFNRESPEVPFSACVHRVGVCNALLIQPFMNFPITDHFGSCAGGYVCTISNMIGMSVRKQDKIGGNFVDVYYVFSKVVVSNERVKQQMLSANLHSEA